MSAALPENDEDDHDFFQKVVNLSVSHYGELNESLKQASSPSELVKELQNARRVIGAELVTQISDAKRDRLLNQNCRISELICQIRHSFNLPL